MKFVKFKEVGIDITAGKEYEVKFETKHEVCIIDDSGDIRTIGKHGSYFEIIDRPVMVKAWDDDDKSYLELELVQDLGEQFEYRYICKDEEDIIAGWKNIEYIKEELTLEQRIEKLEQIINQINK